MKIKADYEMTFSLDEIIVMADDNASYSGGRFARKWLDEIESNPTNFVQFVTQTIDEYDKSVPMDIDKKVAITININEIIIGTYPFIANVNPIKNDVIPSKII